MSNASVAVHKKEDPSARGNFQSSDARAAAKNTASALDDMPPETAAVGSVEPSAPRMQAEEYAKENEPVTVRPRITISRTRIGLEWYSFTAGKPCLVPRHVARHLEEKNII
jgi:hypothetical protein